jgi:hypothetical protein
VYLSVNRKTPVSRKELNIQKKKGITGDVKFLRRQG